MGGSRVEGPVTLFDVAARAGVSIATASRVLNGSGDRRVGAGYRERVLEAADELGYAANALAQAVARGASNLIGLIVQDITDPYFSTIADGVSAVAEEAGMAMLLTTTHNNADRELELLAALRAQRVRAIVLAGSRRTDKSQRAQTRREVETFARAGGRVACISQDHLGTDAVVPRNRAGARALAKSLTDLGHRRFAVLAGPSSLVTVRDRIRGFREGLRDAGLSSDSMVVHNADFTRDGGYEAATVLLQEPSNATCIFAVNDVMAVGAMTAIRDVGLKIPDDLSVAGFDDIATLRDVDPALTTVGLPLWEMGRWAAEMSLDVDAERRTRHVDATVVLRASTASVRRHRGGSS